MVYHFSAFIEFIYLVNLKLPRASIFIFQKQFSKALSSTLFRADKWNYFVNHFSPVWHFTWKPVIWFVVQIKLLFSMWNATLAWNGLSTMTFFFGVFTILIKYFKSKNFYHIKRKNNTKSSCMKIVFILC